MTDTWNPWGMPEIDASMAQRIIKGARRHGAKPRIRRIDGHDFLSVYDPDIGACYGGNELIRRGDVDAVRKMLAA